MRQNDKPCALVITELFMPTKGGTAVWFDEVYRRLGGKCIHIITSLVPGSGKHDSDHPNSIHRLNLKRYRWMKPESLLMYIKLFLYSFKVAFAEPITTVHAGRVLPEGMIALLVGRAFRKSVVVYAHGEEITTWITPLKSRMLSFVYRSVDKVIANSDYTKKLLVDMKVKPERIELIYPGVDTNRFRPDMDARKLKQRIQADHSKLILSVGRLTRRKGFDQVIRSIPYLTDRAIDVHYAIIGIGEDMGYLEEMSEELGISDRVHLLGHVDPEELPLWYNAADVFAMPNREVNGDTEGFGMVFIEAAACGVPSVAGNAGGTGSAVIHGETGYRVDGDQLKQVATVLEKMLTENELTARLGARALERAREEFSWEAIALRTKSLM